MAKYNENPRQATSAPKPLLIAVPDYLNEALKKSLPEMPPGHVFNLYAPMWVEEPFGRKEKKWGLGEDIGVKFEGRGKYKRKLYDARPGGKTSVLQETSKDYSQQTQKLLSALIERQRTAAQKLESVFFPCRLISPLAIGLGNEHPVENGFSFLSPYGLPYIPGSGLKGVLRRAAEELRDSDGTITSKEIDSLFGPEDPRTSKDTSKTAEEFEAQRGALSFWDAFPDCKSMSLEIMTPHYSEYYQKNKSPHDQGQPTPIPFLVVPPNSNLNLIIQCDSSRLPESEYNWRGKLEQIIEYAGKWVGLGGKTAVGYGAFKIDEELKKKTEAEKAAAEEAKRKREEEARLAAIEAEKKRVFEERLSLMSPEEQEKALKLNEVRELLKETADSMKAYESYETNTCQDFNTAFNKLAAKCEELKSDILADALLQEEIKTVLGKIHPWVGKTKKRRDINKLKNSLFPEN
ncbi:MAG: type III-B CRISPR module RAMP protein Cmr6 [Candidatus Riflebacteria bacterium]|nr:type III-B CRISPR module RAMP protein Cmr6 [Candidatus Riflebacteria bacterium]